MNAPDWIRRNVPLLRPGAKNETNQLLANTNPAGIATDFEVSKPVPSLPASAPRRSTGERLGATLRQKEEALSPRVLRRTLEELKLVADEKVSKFEGGRRAKGVAQWYAKATPEQRRDAWLLMSEQFAPDAQKVKAARELYDLAQGTPEEGQAEIRLRKAFQSPRTRLLQRFSVFPEGLRFLLDMRAELLPHLKTEKRLLALDAELETLFANWFDVAFLELRRISWDSPASLIEKLIQYEAVHAIKGWADVKNRLDSDRRCYGFFHPRLPNEPLIFVEVALASEISPCITPLLDEAAALVDLNTATTAIFYSINNTQAGLRGVTFGDSLIKRVVETLKTEFPKLKTFATLSPIPGLRAWLTKTSPELAKSLQDAGALALDEKSLLREALLRQAARYLGREMTDGKPLDPVARFHLGNGARLERLNWAGDPSANGLRQSWGVMVNYLYDLKKLDKHRAMLAAGQVAMSGEVAALL
ncbi:MAG: malonyl-CoA decarboxylase [Burkholderiaceae bacterium]